MIFLTLVQNIALLVSLSILHNQIMRRWKTDTVVYPILSGLLFGSVGLIGMMTPLVLKPGLIFDGRSIVLSIAGLFGGPIAGGIAAVMCASYRVWLGGPGAIMGVSVITESTCLGIAFYYLRQRNPHWIRPITLLGFGFLVHLIMLLLTSTIRGGASMDVLRTIGLPVLIVYPGGVLLVCLLFLDQEARLKAEKKLQENERNYREIFNSTHEAIFVYDAAGRILDVNEPMLRMFGYPSKEEVLAGNVGNLSSNEPPYSQREAEWYIHKTRSEGPQVFEWLARKRNGETFWIEVSLRSSEIGGIGRILGVLRDISERKKAEEEKVKLEEQLRHALKMESVGRLAGGVAHDFNNMLGVIIGHAEMALERIDSTDPLRQHIQEIQKAACRSADLTRQLLAFARKQSVIPKIVNLNDVISGMKKMLQRLIGENIELIWNPGENLWPIEMDPSQIDQILANLVVNSRDAIKDIGIIIIGTKNVIINEDFCEANQGFVSGGYVLLTVSDNGEGMNRETLDHIFEPFFTTKDMGKGTGLGLATVYGIVEQNKGAILVSSEPEKGTTFTIYLPRYQGESNDYRVKPVKTESVRGTETILLVEDEDMILNLGKTVLEQNGYTVLTARRPTEAVALVENYPDDVHLLITDIIMPEMNGKELNEKLRLCKPRLKCLFMSGYTSDVIAPSGVLDGSIHFIQKPFQVSLFSEKVREALE